MVHNEWRRVAEKRVQDSRYAQGSAQQGEPAAPFNTPTEPHQSAPATG